MRICYLADGRYIHTRRWMSFFKSRGHDMHLVSFVPLEPTHVRALEDIGVKYHGHIGAFHIKRFWLTLRDLKFLKRVLRHEQIDILHSHFLGSNSWYAALSNFHPLVLTIMGGGDVRGPDWKPTGNRERLLTPHALRRADLVTSWSKVMADTVRTFCRPGTPIEIIHGGVDLSRFHPGSDPYYLREKWKLPADAKIVFSPRLMRPLSNITQIAAAAGEVLKKSPNTFFIFAAPGEEREEAYESEVRDALRKAGAAGNVRFIGSIPHEEMADHHRLADVTVSIPSTDGTPMTALESMACGTPVIAGAIQDYDTRYFEPGETVLTAGIGNTSELSDALIKMLLDSDTAARISATAQKRVREYGSYETQMSRMEELYNRLLATHRSA